MRRWMDAALARAADAIDFAAGGVFHPHRTVGDANDPCAFCDYRRGCAGRGASERLARATDARLFPVETELFPAKESASGDDDADAAEDGS